MQKVLGWVEEQAKRYPISHVEIQHSSGVRVDRIGLEMGMTNSDFCNRISAAVSEDSEGYPGSESIYHLFFYKDGGEGQPECRKIIRFSGEPTDADTRASETPDEKGITAQLMRHQEQNMRTAERMSVAAMGDLTAQNRALWDRQKEMQERELESTMLLRKTLLDQGALELQREAQRNEQMLYSKIVEQAEVFLPILISKLVKPKAGSEEERTEQDKIAEDPPLELKLVINFLGTLEPDQYDRVGSILSISQRAALQELQQGGIAAELIPITISRVMHALSADQYADILSVLRGPQQIESFIDIYRTRKHTLDYQKHRALEEAKEADRPVESTP